MMKYNLAEEYEKIKDILEKASDEKTDLVNKIMFIYMEWEKNFLKDILYFHLWVDLFILQKMIILKHL